MPTIFDNGIETVITEEQAKELLAAGVIYPNSEPTWDYSVLYDHEDEYENYTGAFSILAPKS